MPKDAARHHQAYVPWYHAGYTGDSLPLKIIIAFFLGLSLYNAIELIVLALVITVSTFIAAVRKMLCAREARDDVPGGAGDDVSFEEHVDGLERDALCLGDADDGVDDHDDAGAAEDEEGAVGYAGEHYGREL